MSYKNGKDILPARLLAELQKYIQGELIYVPKEENTRRGWGENNGTRSAIKQRNYEIFDLYKKGIKIEELILIYNLSDDSIKKIIMKINKELKNSSV